MRPQPPPPPPKPQKPSSATAAAARETTPEMDDIYDEPLECATVPPAKVPRDHYYSYAELHAKNGGLPSQLQQVSPSPMPSVEELKRLRAATMHGPPLSTQTVTGRLSHDDSRPHPLPLQKNTTLCQLVSSSLLHYFISMLCLCHCQCCAFRNAATES